MISWSGDIEKYCNILAIFPIFLLAIFYCQGMLHVQVIVSFIPFKKIIGQ
jgi:hypothetical protein